MFYSNLIFESVLDFLRKGYDNLHVSNFCHMQDIASANTLIEATQVREK